MAEIAYEEFVLVTRVAVKRATPEPVCPDEVRDECLLPARGETVYWLALADENVELLARGECSEAVARQAFSMLSWKRLNARRTAQALPVTEAS